MSGRNKSTIALRGEFRHHGTFKLNNYITGTIRHAQIQIENQ
jgi:hypothetical protein